MGTGLPMVKLSSIYLGIPHCARDIALFYTVVVINLLKVVTSVAELQGVDKLGRMI
jgi:hypothetical protein